MSLLSRIKSAILGEQPPKLRNRAGGLAWIRNVEDFPELTGRIVTTVRVEPGSVKWEIDPMLHTLARAGVIFSNGKIAKDGDPGVVTAIHDDCLVPLRDPGYDERDESLSYLPAVPKLIPLKVRGEVS